jgi:AraC-like DNA-binding protein
MVAYVSILIIPLFISSFVYYKSGKTLEREIIRANESLLNQVQYVMDTNLRELSRLAVELDFNSNVSEIINSDLIVEDWRRFSVYKLVGELRLYNISNDFISDLAIYFKRNNLVVTPIGSNEGKDYYEINVKGLGISYEEWNRLINEKYSGKYTVIGESNKLVYIKSLPILEPKDAYVNVIITLNDIFFKQTIRNIRWLEKGNAFILDKNNQIISSTNTMESNSVKYEELSDNGFIYKKINGKDVILAYTTSKETDWKYVSVIPEEVFWEKAQYIRKLVFISFPICIILGGVAVYFFLRKNYKPISELTHEFADRSGFGFNSDMNEYSFMREAMSKTIKEKEKISQMLEQQRSFQRYNFLLNLLKGRLEGLKYIHESLSFFDINFISDTFAVIFIYVNDYCNIFNNLGNIDEVEKSDLARYAITNIIEELINRKNKGYFTDADGMLVCLVNLREETIDTAKMDILQAVNEAQSFIRERFNIGFTAAISNVHSTIFGISEAYQEVAQLMEYKMVMGIEKIITYDDIPRDGDTRYQYTLETEQKLINYIRVGEFEYAKDLFEGILVTNFHRSKISAKLKRCFMVDIVGTILRVSEEAQLQYSEVEHILDCKSTEDMKNEILKVIEKACNNINNLKQVVNKGNDFIEKSIELIKNNFSDENLNISFIADNLDISPDYLSRIFKNHTGESMLDYICKIRLTKAKELLVKKESIIAEIAKETGFSNVNTFIRIFKKHEGVTPGQYKSLEV